MEQEFDLVRLIGQMFIDSVKNKMVVSQLAQNSVRLEAEIQGLKKDSELKGSPNE